MLPPPDQRPRLNQPRLQGTSLLRRPESTFHGSALLKPTVQPVGSANSQHFTQRRGDLQSDADDVFTMEIDEPPIGSNTQVAERQALPPQAVPMQTAEASPVLGSCNSTSTSALSNRPPELPPRSKTVEPRISSAIAKKPRRTQSTGQSTSSSERGTLSLPTTPKFGSSSASRGTPLLGPIAPPASPMLSALGSPIIGPSGLVPLEADLQPRAMVRSHEFKEGRRVFHVHFGHGFVRSLEAEPTSSSAAAAAQAAEPQSALTQRTHNIILDFDNPKYKAGLRLRAFYAVPKMVVIPSSSALRKQKLQQAVEATPEGEAQRIALVRSLIAANSIRAACAQICRWKLEEHFDLPLLLERLISAKHYSAALHFSRAYKLQSTFSAASLFRRMLEEKHYEGPLKHVGATQASVDGQHTPADVLQLLVGSGNHVRRHRQLACACAGVHAQNVLLMQPPTIPSVQEELT